MNIFHQFFNCPCLINKHCIGIFYTTQKVHIESSWGSRVCFKFKCSLYDNEYFLIAHASLTNIALTFLHDPEHTH
jgi:hypothetical protein